jgi:hypothetical protein
MTGLNDITAAQLRLLLREHALVVAPGEVLVVQVPPDWSPVIIRELSDGLRAVCSDTGFLGGVTIPVLVVPGTAVTVARLDDLPGGDLLAERPVVLPDHPELRRQLAGIVAPMPPDPFARDHGADALASLDFAETSATARNATMNPNRATKYTALGFALNSLVDQGQTASIDEVHQRIADGSLWDWLVQAGVPSIKMLPAGDRGVMLEVFQSLWNPARPERNFYVERNGLATLVAYCFEGLQRLSEGEPPETAGHTDRL